MIYSVFDWERGLYHYFEGPGEKLGIRPKPRRENSDSRGQQLETLLPVIPPGSTRAGTGPEARGRVAVFDDATRSRLNAEGATPVSTSNESISSLIGLGGFGAAPDNPLVKSPWVTVGVWLAVTWYGFKLADRFGQWVAKQR